MPVTSKPRRTRWVMPLSAASVVLPSKHSPGPSPYIGWKWSKPQTPSKPSSSANRARDATSDHGTRCWAMSSPKRIPKLYHSRHGLPDDGAEPDADRDRDDLQDEQYDAQVRGHGAPSSPSTACFAFSYSSSSSIPRSRRSASVSSCSTTFPFGVLGSSTVPASGCGSGRSTVDSAGPGTADQVMGAVAAGANGVLAAAGTGVFFARRGGGLYGWR